MRPPIHHRRAVKLAAAIYEPTHGDIRNALHGRGVCASVAEIADDASPLKERAMVVPTAGPAFVVFRGTRNGRQWRSNGDIRKRPWRRIASKGRVHRGFWRGFMALRDLVVGLLEQWRDRELVVVGHSRGAAIAILFALFVKALGWRVAEVHLFGCPRALNIVLALVFDRWCPWTWNWIANNDAVHRVPFKWMRYRHVGTRMYFDSSDHLHVDPSWRVKVKGQIIGRVRGGWLDGLSDHNAIKEYERLVGVLEFYHG